MSVVFGHRGVLVALAGIGGGSGWGQMSGFFADVIFTKYDFGSITAHGEVIFPTDSFAQVLYRWRQSGNLCHTRRA